MIYKIVKGFFKFAVAFIIIGTVGILGLRLFSFNYYPRDVRGVVYTERLAELYKQNGSLDAVTWKLGAAYDAAGTGDFFFNYPIYFNDGETFTVTIRYNDSLMKSITESWDIDADTAPLDLPVNAVLTDMEGNEISAAASVSCRAFGLYTYRRYTFENVKLPEDGALYLDIYKKGESSKDGVMYSRLEVYYSGREPVKYNLTARDKSLLGR